MSKVWLLSKIMLKNAGPAWSAKKGGGWKSLLLLLAVGLGIIPLILAMVAVTAGLYDGLAQVGQESALLGIAVAGASLAIFVLGIVYVLTVFYYSQDVEHLLPLPLSPVHILGAKFLVALYYEYLTLLVLIGPILITFGVKSGGGVLYYLVGLLVFLALPLIPLTLSSLVVMLFMRFTSFGKSKDRFRLIGGVLAIGIAIGFQAFIQRQSSGAGNGLEQFQQMIQTEQGLLGIVTKMFPASKLAALAMFESGALSGLGCLFAFYAAAAVALAVFLIAGDRLYFAGVMGISESRSSRKRVEQGAIRKGLRSRPGWLAYAQKEWKILWRTPAYFMNCVLSSILLPLFGMIPLLSRRDSGEMLAALSSWMQGGQAGGISLAVGVAIIAIMTGSNSTSVTAITREGQGFSMLKTFPLSPGQIIMAKLVPGTVLSLFSMALLLAEGVWLLTLSPSFVLLTCLVGVPAILLINLLGILVDLQMPKLVWGSEQEAVKQNLNPLFSLLFGLLAGGICVLLAFSLGFSMAGLAALLFVLFALADWILYRVLRHRGPEWLSKIES